MSENAPDPIVVLILMDETPDLSAIRAVAPDRVEIHVEQPGAFEDDGGMFPPSTGLKSYREPWTSDLSAPEREALLARTNVLAASIPFPLHLASRMPNLRWAEFVWAGVSDFTNSDLWDTGVHITSGRGVVQSLPIAEMIIAAAMAYAKQLTIATDQTRAGKLDDSQMHLRLVAGKTIGVVGLGGIGGETARLAKALGMRVLATRRSATSRQDNVDGIDTLYPSAELHAMLGECDFVAVSAPLTPDTLRLFDAQAFAAMRDGAFFANVARGEVVDEAALKDAIRSGKLGSVYLDVYDQERQRLPDPELIAQPNVVMTPHNSGKTDVVYWPMAETFAANLRRFIAGEPLTSEVDFARGY